jgi:RimJ/RimL family protein N-acetyltransferase
VAISIRPLEAGDWQALKRLRLDALRFAPGMFYKSYAQEVGMADADWQSLARGGPQRQVFGLFDGTEMTGITAVFTDRDDPSGTTAKLGMSYIAPAYRGRGLARRLYEVRLAWIKERAQFTRIAVSHRRSNVASGRAIQRAGFTKTGSRSRSWHDGKTEDEDLYEMQL